MNETVASILSSLAKGLGFIEWLFKVPTRVLAWGKRSYHVWTKLSKLPPKEAEVLRYFFECDQEVKVLRNDSRYTRSLMRKGLLIEAKKYTGQHQRFSDFVMPSSVMEALDKVGAKNLGHSTEWIQERLEPIQPHRRYISRGILDDY